MRSDNSQRPPREALKFRTMDDRDAIGSSRAPGLYHGRYVAGVGDHERCSDQGFELAVGGFVGSMLGILMPVVILVLRPRHADECDPPVSDVAESPVATSPAEAEPFRLASIVCSGRFISMLEQYVQPSMQKPGSIYHDCPHAPYLG